MTNRVEGTLWVIAALCAVLSAFVVSRPLGGVATPTITRGTNNPRGIDSMLYTSARVTADANPFRLDRAPSPVPFAPEAVRIQSGTAPAVVARRPTLLLRGIVGGPPWRALVEGFPGREAPTVVRAGDRVGPLLVASVNRDAVVVRGMDTTWQLTLARAWR